MREHGDLTHYNGGGLANENAAVLLDRIRDQFLAITNPFDCLFDDGTGAAAPTLLSLDLIPKYAQLVLVRLELVRSMWATAPKSDIKLIYLSKVSNQVGGLLLPTQV